MGIIVQKFGGTSVGSGDRLRMVADIIENSRKRSPIIAVVSAMSPTRKAEGTTNLLLEASQLALEGEPFAGPLSRIEALHLAAIEVAISNRDLRREMQDALEDELNRLHSFLEAIEVIRELSARSEDVLLSTGERLSATLLAATLRDRGLPARLVDLTYAVPEGRRSVDPLFFRGLQPRFAELCRPQDEDIPIVTGFFGLVPGGLLTSIGRGYTDFTAALVAAGLGYGEADEMQVWKEVDGIFTADPRRVPTARVLPSISPIEASELTYFGSEVLHPFTMERVTSARIPIRIKNTFNPDGPGTVILEGDPERAVPVTAVTAKSGITIFSVLSNRMYNAYGFLSRVFNVLNDHGVVVDLVSTSEVSISCTAERAETVYAARSDLEQLGDVSILEDRAILAMVGRGMKYAVGTAGKMFSALAGAGINIEMISQGASEINISCVVTNDQAEPGLRAIHAAFLEQP